MMKTVLLIIATTLLFACGNAQKSKEKPAEAIKVEESKYGQEITMQGALTPQEFLGKLSGKESVEVKMTSKINSVCSKKGCWMVLDLGNDETMRVTFKDYGFFMPLDASGKIATVQGVGKIDTTDVATLKHYAEDAKASQEEIDAITEPEINYSFEAVGVILRDDLAAVEE